jgi:hypothetical protein
MTKGLPTPTFEAFRSSLCVAAHTRQTAGGVEYTCIVVLCNHFVRVGAVTMRVHDVHRL